jgi:hypothetical protein
MIWPEKVIDFARKPMWIAIFLRFGIPIWAVRDSFGGEIRCRSENDEPAARRPSGRPVSPAVEADHQSPSSAGAAGGGDRLGFSGETLELGVSRGDRGSRRRGWWPAHFTQSRDDLEATFNALGLGPRLQLLEPVMLRLAARR